MATTRFGHLDDFTLKNSKVGIGTSTPTEALEVIGGSRSKNIEVTGIATFTSYEGFQNKETSYVDNVNITGGESGSLSEVVIGAGLTMSVGTGATSGQGNIKSLKVSNTFTPPIGGTNDRPSAPQPGALFYNKDFRTIEYWDGNFWRQVDNTTRSGRAILGGGYSPGNTAYPDVNLITIPTTGNATNFGQLHTARTSHGACSSSTRGIFLGGSPDNDATEYYTLASRGNGINFGDLTSTGRRYTSSFSSSTRGFSAGGKDDPAVTNEIDYCEISTLSSWLDFGDLTVAALYWGGLSSPTRGLTLVADDPASQVINSVTIASKGNATDFGRQMCTGGFQSAAANSVRGLWAGGYASSPRQASGYTDVIQKITIASNGNASYFGDLTGTKLYGDGSSTSTRGVFAGSASQYSNVIEYVTIETSGNAIDFGDLPMATGYHGMTSDSHGGLGGF